jgi:hypothetical protein
MGNTATRSNRASSTLPPAPSSPDLMRAYVAASERAREALAEQERLLTALRAADSRALDYRCWP